MSERDTGVARYPAHGHDGWPALRLGRDGYPPLLAAIFDPPRVLYVRGDRLELLAGPCVAIVGARSCTAYGAGIARTLGRDLARAGAVVVSGLARGIDAAAHRGALEGGGRTVGVLGCGIDRDYPASNAWLAGQIAAHGLIVSEYGPGVEPAPWRFPARNRIVAGLALATIVVEARERSGALITADFALEEGREVLAVPGEITSACSQGTNRLLTLGAAPLLSAADALSSLGLHVRPAAEPPGESEASVLAALRAGATDADGLARATGLPPGAVAAALARLELEGLTTAGEGVYRASA